MVQAYALQEIYQLQVRLTNQVFTPEHLICANIQCVILIHIFRQVLIWAGTHLTVKKKRKRERRRKRKGQGIMYRGYNLYFKHTQILFTTRSVI